MKADNIKSLFVTLPIIIIIPAILFFLVGLVFNIEEIPNSQFIYIIAIILGIKHAFDIDHLVAVSGFLVNTNSWKKTIKMSSIWALGHMITAGFVTIILYSLKDTFLSVIFENMELFVPIMLIIIATFCLILELNLFNFHKNDSNIIGEDEHTHIRNHTHTLVPVQKQPHSHTYTHKHSHTHFNFHKWDGKHNYLLLFGVGIIQGIASNDEILMLFTISFGFTNLIGILFGVSFFTVGVVIGMFAYSFLINTSKKTFKNKNLSKMINISVAIISIVYAIYLLLGQNGLNLFEVLLN
ncbi:MAG: hypothetical protein GY870_10505 [archaeon]|nr:hypothetical protein [archaeon]